MAELELYYTILLSSELHVSYVYNNCFGLYKQQNLISATLLIAIVQRKAIFNKNQENRALCR